MYSLSSQNDILIYRHKSWIVIRKSTDGYTAHQNHYGIQQ